MLFTVSYRTKSGAKKTRYFIDPFEAMRLEKKLSEKKGITQVTLGKAWYMKNKAAQELGSLGGKSTKAKHGIEHYRRLAANMNRKKALKRAAPKSDRGQEPSYEVREASIRREGSD
jgi:hypothetical protein